MTRRFVKVEYDKLDIGKLAYVSFFCFQFRVFSNKKVEKKYIHKRGK